MELKSRRQVYWRPEQSRISDLSVKALGYGPQPVGHCQANFANRYGRFGFGHDKQNLQENAKCKQVEGEPKKSSKNTSSFRLFALQL